MGPLEGVRLALFDMDGTLAPTEGLHFESVNVVLRAFGAEIPAGEMGRYVGMGDRAFWAAARRRFGIEAGDAVLIERRNRALVALAPGRVRAFDGVEDLLDLLRSRGIRLAVASSSPMPQIEAILAECGLRGRFERLFSGQDPAVAREKPHPDVYLHALAALGERAAATVVFEDSAPGISAANAAGCRCYVLDDGAARGRHDLSAADRIFRSPRECAAFLAPPAGRA